MITKIETALMMIIILAPLILVAGCIIAGIILAIKGANSRTPWVSNKYQKEHTTKIEKNIDYSKSYQRKYILTPFEYREYKKLKVAAERQKLQICPKVRLLDLIEPRKDNPKFKTLLYKIQSKHVDFVLCDKDLYVKAIIELDDNSHNRPDRVERDQFIDQILRSVGYIVVHVRSIQPDIIEMINSIEETDMCRNVQEQIKQTNNPGPQPGYSQENKDITK